MENQPTDGSLLMMEGVSKSFHGVKVLNEVNFDVRPGEVHALVGENGAGKSTLIKILSGVFSRDRGEIMIEGKKVEITKPVDALQLGIKVVFQELDLVPNLSVAENIYLEEFPLKKAGFLEVIDWGLLFSKAHNLLSDLGLDIDVRVPVEHLSIAQQQMVEIARSLAYGAKIIAMDEPTSALSTNEIQKLFHFIRQLKDKNVGIIYVSHKLDEIFEISDRITVLRDGGKIWTRPTNRLNEAVVIKSMVGRELNDLFPRTHTGKGEAALQVHNIFTQDKLRSVSFKVYEGEVLGIFGLMGAGRTELARALFGVDPISQGEMFFDGARFIPHPAIACERGMGLVTEDRKRDGLVLPLSVQNNMTLAALKDISSGGLIKGIQEKGTCQKFRELLNIKARSLNQKVMYLSGGNQQKVIMARWLLKNLKILILDEPTRGIDVGSKAEIHALIDELACRKVAIVMMTSEMPELLGVSDRILVMWEGKITGEFKREEATEEKIMACAVGGSSNG